MKPRDYHQDEDADYIPSAAEFWRWLDGGRSDDEIWEIWLQSCKNRKGKKS